MSFVKFDDKAKDYYFYVANNHGAIFKPRKHIKKSVWLVKALRDSGGGYIAVFGGHQLVCFPVELVGKRVRLKVEVLD